MVKICSSVEEQLHLGQPVDVILEIPEDICIEDVCFNPKTLIELPLLGTLMRQVINFMNYIAITVPPDMIEEVSELLQAVKVYPDDTVSTLGDFPITDDGDGPTYYLSTDRRKAIFTPVSTKQLLGVPLDYKFKVGRKTFKFDGTGVRVAVVDTGAIAEYTTYNASPDLPIDLNGHGIHVSSILSEVAPGTEKFAFKALGTPFGMGRASDVIKGMEMAHQAGAKIINNSLGGRIKGGYNDDAKSQAVDELAKKGVLVVSAIGNSVSIISSPGWAKLGISVGSASILDNDKVSWYSSRGDTSGGRSLPTILSYGGGRAVRGRTPEEVIGGPVPFGSMLDIKDMELPTGFKGLKGTSQAAPHVSGMLAIFVQACKEIAGFEPDITDVIKMFNAESVTGFVDGSGFGVFNIDWAMRYIEGKV